jgi:hypothetical protein
MNHIVLIRTLRLAALPVAATLAHLPMPAAAQVLGPPPAPQTQVQPGQPAADWRQTLGELKLTPQGVLERKRHHSEVDAVTADGRRVTVSFDPQGRIWEIEVEDHDKYRYGDSRPLDTGAAVEAARRAGFQEPALYETKRHHAVVRARTDKGATVDLHVDRGGVIYKQVWIYETGWRR